MSERVFYCDEHGQLWWRDWCWGDDQFARDRMLKVAKGFESPEGWCPSLAKECRQALADYDFFYLENEDEELRYETETAA